jgi:arsenate reductase
MYPTLQQSITQIAAHSVAVERQEVLQPLIEYIQSKVIGNQPIRLNFICTHNSRRSHLSQVWAQTMGTHFGVQNLSCYSGGTEATALFPKVAETLLKQGFTIQPISEGTNPVYAIKYSPNEPAIMGFSKCFDDAFNPQSEFAAIMTCSSADEGCPFIAGAEKRLPIRYEDPKAFDNTPLMEVKYAERSIEIAAEMYYVFSKINK